MFLFGLLRLFMAHFKSLVDYNPLAGLERSAFARLTIHLAGDESRYYLS